MEKDDNIQFDQISDLDWNFGKRPKIKAIEKEFDSLYDELLDKCNPSKFQIEKLGLEQFNIANEIYAQLLEYRISAESVVANMETDDTLKKLRNRAIEELGIHISSTKLFNKLKTLYDPNQFINREPYEKELVEKAAILYDSLIKNSDDILSLEYIANSPAAEYFFQLVEDKDFESLSPKDYLEKYPNGKYYIELDDIYFQKYDAQEYLSKFQKGKHYEELDDFYFQEKSAQEYLSKYPNGKHSEEAICFQTHIEEYLESYPNGKWAEMIEESRKSNIIFIVGVSLLILIFFVAILYSI